MDSITFRPLHTSDFPQLCKWLNTPHVHKIWGENITWTEEKIQEKYSHHVKGYQLVGREKKPVHAFIILWLQKPIGYIQYYNVYDFPRTDDNVKDILAEHSYFLPRLAGLDLYIGEQSATGKGIGTLVISSFLEEYVWKEYGACLVDPDKTNLTAIKAYEKAGFKPLKTLGNVLLMICIRKENL